MEKIRDEIAKKTLFEFKKFARENKFWEEYKRNSSAIRRCGSFIKVINIFEPVQLIQSVDAYCGWPSSYSNNGESWSSLSKQWAKVCLDKFLYRDCTKCISYVKLYISQELLRNKNLLGKR